MNSQNNPDKKNNNLKCSCDRPKTSIICTNCGYTMFGRIRFTCPIHWQTSFLYDISGCANCKAQQYMLLEFNPESRGK